MAVRQPGPGREGVHEGGDVEREREYPQQRESGQIGADVLGGAEHERGGHCGEGEHAPVCEGARWGVFARCGVGFGRRCGFGHRRVVALCVRPCDGKCAGGGHGEHGPGVELHGGVEQRLEHEGVGDERGERTCVRHAVQEVGVARSGPERVVGAHERRACERGGARDQYEQRGDVGAQGDEEPQCGPQAIGRRPGDAGGPCRGGDERSDREEDYSEHGTARAHHDAVREHVADEQRALKEDHGGRPHCGGSSERGEHGARGEGLDPEHECGAGKDERGVGGTRAARGSWVLALRGGRHRGLRVRRCAFGEVAVGLA